MSDPAETPLRADRPIKTRTEDRLGRAFFVGAVTQAIANWRGDDSLVLALYGAWGSGKTSVKNLVRESLTDLAPEERPVTVDFNAWEFSGRDQLAEAFFREIGEKLGQGGTGQAQPLRAGFQTLARFSGLTGRMLGPLSRLAPVVTALFGPEYVTEGLLLGALGATAGQVASQLTDLAADAKATAELGSSRTVAQLKVKISALLREQGRNVVVFIDDVDRLTADEIGLLFRLVKVNADLPRLVYVLLFQRDVVERALERDVASSGRDYLAKIVQAGFDLPVIHRESLRGVLFEELNRVIKPPSILKSFRLESWRGLFLIIEPYFRTLRDICRFTSTLRFHVGLFIHGDSFEVDPVDLIGLEILRVFEPEVYDAVSRSKAELTDDPQAHRFVKEGEEARFLTRCHERLLAAVPDESRRSRVESVLAFLFPRLESLKMRFHGPEITQEWERQRRVCSHRFFERYFHLTIPEGELSGRDLDEVLACLGSREQLVTALHGLHERELLPQWFERMEAFKEAIDLTFAEPFLTALFDIGDLLPKGRRYWLETESSMHAARVVYWYLRRDKDDKRRERTLRTTIERTSGIFLPTYVVALEEPPKDGRKGPREQLISEESMPGFRRLCAEKIGAAAASGKLRENAYLDDLLWHWREWGTDRDAPREWVVQLTSTPDGLLAFLQSFLLEGFSEGRTTRRHQYMYLSQLEPFISIDFIEEQLRGIPSTSLSERQRDAVEAFAIALKRRREGKPDDRPAFLDGPA